MGAITNNLFFSILISLIAYEIGLMMNKKTGLPLLNPLVIAIGLVITTLCLLNVDIESYQIGGNVIHQCLGPATVVLAVPLYKQFNKLKSNAIAILVGIFGGTIIGIISIVILAKLFQLDHIILKSLLPKSVTTPIGIEISQQIGGNQSITVMAILLTGIFGAMIASYIFKILKIRNPIAIGVGIGTAAHAIGTTKAVELGETEGAMSSLAIGIAGLITVLIVPMIEKIMIAIM